MDPVVSRGHGRVWDVPEHARDFVNSQFSSKELLLKYFAENLIMEFLKILPMFCFRTKSNKSRDKKCYFRSGWNFCTMIQNSSKKKKLRRFSFNLLRLTSDLTKSAQCTHMHGVFFQSGLTQCNLCKRKSAFRK